MKSVSLKAYPRAEQKRTGAKRVRANGRVPAVIYGRHNAPQNLELAKKEIEDVIHHSVTENVLLDLTLGGDAGFKRLAMVQEVQHHPLSGQVLHIDLHEVKEDEKVTITVPVETTGEAAGVKTGGGVLEHVLFKLKVRGLPKDLPELIEVDVSNLELGQSIHIGELKGPANVEILGEKKIVVISVALPKTEAQEAAETATTGAIEPEMIKEKKEEGTAPAAGAKGGEKAGDKAAEKPAEKGKKEPEKKK
jgi:large subunit ribosomal protein L25